MKIRYPFYPNKCLHLHFASTIYVEIAEILYLCRIKPFNVKLFLVPVCNRNIDSTFLILCKKVFVTRILLFILN